MTKLGIIGAMDVEVETLLSEMEQVASTKKAGSTFHEGVLMGLPVVLVQCGVGKVNAALCVQILRLLWRDPSGEHRHCGVSLCGAGYRRSGGEPGRHVP